MWVATVGNIDWPSRAGLSTADQQSELLAILDRAKAVRLNAVVLQVRPATDALYASPLEPWSEYLTGEMGRAPDPFWDPLAFAVTEAHRRGLELHAWFNPYRARQTGAKGPPAANHVSRVKPEIVRQYAKMQWMDPGEPETMQWSLRVIRDVVHRYDVDGVHIDDYFYPYPENDAAGKRMEFPDSASYAAYRARGGTLARDDWRRDNVDRFVHEMYETVKREKPWVKVGISPFGIWRPGNPAGVCCFDAYTQLYADSRKWLQAGWADYFTPQLYWKIAAPQQSYPALLAWWVQADTLGRHLWPGNYLSRVGDGPNGWSAAEIDSQIRLTRAQRGAGGNVWFSMKALMSNQGGVTDTLSNGAYAEPALVPASPWLPGRTPAVPRVVLRRAGSAVALDVAPGDREPVRLWLVRARYGAAWTTDIVSGDERRIAVRPPATRGAPDEVRVSAVDRAGRESPASAVTLASTVSAVR
ncbi:protein of unknown function DUF187 [Gemmatirosa kalamazoonensis]|uniref:Glycosyl hydrolase-like 10 domain-containing protein n=1 Tax=Gemmatirosa kalamazoonensis TaxID=861299 RepID=W0RKF8_9BACT|nr:protein of unknown function DUF187 [Gemmatirosa kalamazoonensis]